MSGTITVDPRIESALEIAELRETYDVSERQAEALLEAFESVDAVTAAEHEELLTVKWIGPKTADDISPKSVRLRWAREYTEFPPVYTDEQGYLRHKSERDKHPKREIEDPYEWLEEDDGE